MTASELHEHLSYWNDDIKLAAYTAALEEVLSPGDHVLDLGTGTGLLGMLAARAGAEKVWAYDGGPIIETTERVARQNGFGDIISFVRGFTTDVELPHVDVAICDQIGGLAFDAGVLNFFADVEQRALKPSGTFIPAAFDLYLAPVHAPTWYDQVAGWSTDRAGFDLSTVHKIAANTQYAVGPEDFTLAAPGELFASIASSDNSPIKGECSWVVPDQSVLHGFVGWFDASMSPSVKMTNDPTDPNRMKRWINFYPVESPTALSAGDRIEATIDIRPAGSVVTWTSSINDGPTMKQSTFYASFDSGLGAATADPSPAAPERRELLRELVDLHAQGVPVAEIIQTCKAHTELFVSEQAATAFAHRFLKLL